jgi:hypothetical protein
MPIEQRSTEDAQAPSPIEQQCLEWARTRMSEHNVRELEHSIEDVEYVYIVEYTYGNEVIRAPLLESAIEYPLGTTLDLMVDPKDPRVPMQGTRRGNAQWLVLGLPIGLALLVGGCAVLISQLRK